MKGFQCRKSWSKGHLRLLLVDLSNVLEDPPEGLRRREPVLPVVHVLHDEHVVVPDGQQLGHVGPHLVPELLDMFDVRLALRGRRHGRVLGQEDLGKVLGPLAAVVQGERVVDDAALADSLVHDVVDDLGVYDGRRDEEATPRAHLHADDGEVVFDQLVLAHYPDFDL